MAAYLNRETIINGERVDTLTLLRKLSNETTYSDISGMQDIPLATVKEVIDTYVLCRNNVMAAELLYTLWDGRVPMVFCEDHIDAVDIYLRSK